jgi:hypothetical protein
MPLSSASHFSSLTFRDQQVAGTATAISIHSYIRWECPLGTWMPRNLDYDRDFNQSVGCPFPCSAGRYGATSNITNYECTDACPVGHVCPEGTAQPLPCSSGRYNRYVNGIGEDSCLTCEPGKIQPHEGSSACQWCASGTFQNSRGSTACLACDSGGHCDDPSSCGGGFQPCVSGGHIQTSHTTRSVSTAQHSRCTRVLSRPGRSIQKHAKRPSPLASRVARVQPAQW